MEKVLRAHELFRAGNEDIPNVGNTFVHFASLPDLLLQVLFSRRRSILLFASLRPARVSFTTMRMMTIMRQSSIIKLVTVFIGSV